MLWLRGVPKPLPGYEVSTWLFLRGLGAVYLCAFLSLWVQVEGLVGSQGVLPIQPFLETARERLGPSAWLRLPTLAWLDASDAMLNGLCAAGVALSVLLVVGF